MGKLKLVFILLLLVVSLPSQKNFVEIRGKVYAFTRHDKDTLPLKNADIFLKLNDSIIIKQTTDAAGQYKFLVKTINVIATLPVQSTNRTFNKEKKEYCFIASGEEKKLNLSKSNVYISDFQFRQTTDCFGSLPELIFEKDSVRPINFMDSLSYIRFILKDFPLMTLQINGNSGCKEANPDELSRKRAEFIYNELIQFGIEKNRLSIKAFGSTSSLFSEKMIKSAKTAEEKAALRQRNSRLTFQVKNFGIE